MKQKFNDGTIMVMGYVPSDAEKASDNEKAPWKFSVKVDEKPKKEGEQRGEAVWLGIASWHSSASQVRKGDTVIVLGKKLESREYNGKTYWTLTAEAIVWCNKAPGASAPPAAAIVDNAAAGGIDISAFEEFMTDDVPF